MRVNNCWFSFCEEHPKIKFPAASMKSLTNCENPEAADMNGRFQMQGGKNWILPK